MSHQLSAKLILAISLIFVTSAVFAESKKPPSDDEVAKLLNERPRKTLGFETPADKFAECVALTG